MNVERGRNNKLERTRAAFCERCCQRGEFLVSILATGNLLLLEVPRAIEPRNALCEVE